MAGWFVQRLAIQPSSQLSSKQVVTTMGLSRLKTIGALLLIRFTIAVAGVLVILFGVIHDIQAQYVVPVVLTCSSGAGIDARRIEITKDGLRIGYITGMKCGDGQPLVQEVSVELSELGANGLSVGEVSVHGPGTPTGKKSCTLLIPADHVPWGAGFGVTDHGDGTADATCGPVGTGVADLVFDFVLVVTSTPPPTPTSTPTSTPTPSSTPTTTLTPTPTSTSTITPTPTVTPTSTPTPTITPTPTSSRTPTVTPTLPSTPTASATTLTTTTAAPTPTTGTPPAMSPTATSTLTPATPPPPPPTATAAPSATQTSTPAVLLPQFDCSGWCTAGTVPGSRRQIVTSDTPVEDWRVIVNGFMLGLLTEETPTQAILDAPEGFHVRIEALYHGEWITACDSDVQCLPTSTPSVTPTIINMPATTSTNTPTSTATSTAPLTNTPIATSTTATSTAGTPTTTPTAGTPTTTSTAGTPTTTPTAGTPTTTPTAGTPTTTSTAGTPTATSTAGTPTTTPTAGTPTTTSTAGTPTATSTAGTPTPTATVPPTACAIAGTVTMQGRSDHSGVTIWIDGLWTTTSTVEGRFRADSVIPGVYQVRASHLGYLSRQDSAVQCLAGSVAEMPSATLLGGDSNNDKRVNLFDLVKVGASYRTCAGDEGFEPEADINQTGCVDVFDLVLVGINYGLTGPGDWPAAVVPARSPGE